MRKRTTEEKVMKIKKIVLILLVLILFQILRLEIEKIIAKVPVTPDYVNYSSDDVGESIGNYIILDRTNDITRLPLLGSGVYLYDVDSDKMNLLSYIVDPVGTYFENVICDNTLYGGICRGVENYKGYKKELKKNIRTKTTVENPYDNYSICDDKMYFIDADLYGGQTGNLEVKDLNTGENRIFVEGDIECFGINEGKMYCFDKHKQAIIIIDLDTNERNEYPYQCSYMWRMGFFEQENVFCFAEGDNENGDWRIVEYDLNTNEKKILWDQIHPYNTQHIYVRDECVYWCDYSFEGKVYCYDQKESSEKMLFEFKEVKAETDSPSFYFCDDYIVFEVYDSEHNEGRNTMFVYDYNGELIRKVKR